MSNRLPNRMSYLPAALPIQISAAQWYSGTTFKTQLCHKKQKLEMFPLMSANLHQSFTLYNH